jgi:hypothetical protein
MDRSSAVTKDFFLMDAPWISGIEVEMETRLSGNSGERRVQAKGEGWLGMNPGALRAGGLWAAARSRRCRRSSRTC